MFSRRIGSFRALVAMMTAATVAFSGFFLVTRPNVEISSRDWAILAVLSVFVAINYRLFFRALELGPIAIVAPVVTAYAAVVVLLSMIILGERLNAGQGVGAAITFLGVVMATTDLRNLRKIEIGRGIWLGLICMLGFGLTVFVGSLYARTYGWFLPAFLTRVMIAILLLGVTAFRRRLPWRGLGAGSVVLISVMGIFESGGFFAFSRGAELGDISVVAAASASYPVIPIVMGLLAFRERPAPNQLVGITTVVAGVLLLALSG